MVFPTMNTSPLSIRPRKRLGHPTYYGRGTYGVTHYGVRNERYGIYQQRHCSDGLRTVKMRFYWPHYSQSEAIVASRNKFAAAIAAWQLLTTEQKAVYNRRAIGKHKSGYNIYISEYMKS